MKDKNIIVTAFITLWASLFMIGFIYLSVTGYAFKPKILIECYTLANKDANLYEIIIKAINGDNYELMKPSEKTFFFGNWCIKNIQTCMSSSWGDNWFLNALLGFIKVFSILFLGIGMILGYILDLVIMMLSAIVTFIYTLVYLFNYNNPNFYFNA